MNFAHVMTHAPWQSTPYMGPCLKQNIQAHSLEAEIRAALARRFLTCKGNG
jgi:hypothetical protein